MSVTSSMVHFRLQSLRATLEDDSLLNTSSSRKNAFAASMHQFDEQMAAAKVVTPATRPINLYYGLVQAGYAICAARLDEQRWSFDYHGLKYGKAGSLPAVAVATDDREGGYQFVSRAITSQIISEPVKIGDLWASNPDLGPTVPLGASPTHKTAVLLEPVYDLKHRSVVLGEQPTERIFPYANLRAPGSAPRPEERDQWLSDLREEYFGLHEALLARPEEEALRNSNDGETYEAKLRWSTSVGQSQEEFDKFFDVFAPVHRYAKARYALPKLSGEKPPTPLMQWWLMLYTFSNIARYHPAEWARDLDLDKSRYAAALNKAMDDALTALPHLVLNALDAHPTHVKQG